jgi:hypothetical protein
MVETNPPRNNQPETHPDDERGRWPERFSPAPDGKISPCLGNSFRCARPVALPWFAASWPRVRVRRRRRGCEW